MTTLERILMLTLVWLAGILGSLLVIDLSGLLDITFVIVVWTLWAAIVLAIVLVALADSRATFYLEEEEER